MGNDSIDVSLENIWRSWFVFRKGKLATAELDNFQYHLEGNLFDLFSDLAAGRYHHGGYKKFIVSDNKRREVSVASIRDRVVHRLLYDYLNKIYDKTFICDAWSCRLGKGLLGAIERAQSFLRRYPSGYVWKGDVRKFFDSVDKKTLLKILSLRIKDKKTFNLTGEIIYSFPSDVICKAGGGVGMPIGNLTSQIFANIYLNEFDRFVKHILKPKNYLRYGDDFIMVETDLEKLNIMRTLAVDFLCTRLKLKLNSKSDKIFLAKHGLQFLGMVIWPHGRKLKKRNTRRINARLNFQNAASYRGLVLQHESAIKKKKHFHWLVEKSMME